MTAASEPPWEELHGSLRAFIGRRVRNQSDVDDLVQRVLLQIVKSRVQRGRKQLKAVLEECCRIQLDRRGTIVAYERRRPDSCGPCGGGTG